MKHAERSRVPAPGSGGAPSPTAVPAGRAWGRRGAKVAAAIVAAGALVVVGALFTRSPAGAPGAAASPPRPGGPTSPPGAVLTGAAHRTAVTVNGRRPGAVFQGIGAISGGGGNSRYLIDYPEPERSRILDYLFTPGYGASLQLLKLEIGGDSNSTDGSEPSIEHRRGQINCNAGYEWWIAEQAVLRNPRIKLYALQWTAPGWVANRAGSLWTRKDVSYVINWMNCARSHGLTISYLGGRDEAGYSARWYEWMRAALDRHGYGYVQIVAADQANSRHWQVASALARDKAFNRAVSIIGEHDSCGHHQYHCATTKTARSLHKPLWLSEQGGLNPSTEAGGEVRAINRMYIRGGMTALLEWPLMSSMPPGLPGEGLGLVVADQPWAGSYTVTKQLWATAQTTQFVRPGWRYIGGASKLLGSSGSCDTYVSPDHSDWSMVAANTGSKAGQKIRPQTIDVTVRGGLKAAVIHVWATNLNTMDTSQWFVHEPDIRPAHGRFRYTIPAGYVVTFTTTAGHGKVGSRRPAVPPVKQLPLPYANSLAGNDGSGEPPLLAPLDGAFGPVPCLGGRAGLCLEQLTPRTPVLWHSRDLDYPYAVIGGPGWSNYVVRVDVLLTSRSGTAGVIGRFSQRASRLDTPRVGTRVGLFKGYLLDVSERGVWKLLRNRVTATTPRLLAAGRVAALGVDRWHTLSLSMKGSTITAAIDGRVVGSAHNSAYTSGLAGLEAGAFTGTWPIDQYRNLAVTPLG